MGKGITAKVYQIFDCQLKKDFAAKIIAKSYLKNSDKKSKVKSK